jgi:hypothetical protein
MTERIAYKKGYKYWLVRPYSLSIPIFPKDAIVSSGGFIALNREGLLSIKAGYAWDGPSGPTFDTKTFMRGSLVHDAGYQLMREGKLDQSHRDTIDRLLGSICRSDGMCGVRVWYVVGSVQRFAGGAASTENKKKILYAP